MIKYFTISNDGRKQFYIGLSTRNLEKLRENLPIHFNKEELGRPMDFDDVFIYWGDTEESMRDELVKLGLVDKNTIIRPTLEKIS